TREESEPIPEVRSTRVPRSDGPLLLRDEFPPASAAFGFHRWDDLCGESDAGIQTPWEMFRSESPVEVTAASFPHDVRSTRVESDGNDWRNKVASSPSAPRRGTQ